MNEKEVCWHNQTGFCKYRQQCTKEHVNEVCNECKDTACKMRHPKKCKTFEVFGNCKFDQCAYLHVDNETNKKMYVLENEVKKLKLEVNNILKNAKEEKTKNVETLEHDVKELKHDVKMLAKSIKNTELVLQLMDKDTDTLKNYIVYEKGTMKCTVCKYRCKKAITMKKHMNTKHECNEEFQSSDALAVHV